MAAGKLSFSGTIRPADGNAGRAEIIRLAHVIWREHYTPLIGSAQVEYMLAQRYTQAALAAAQAHGYRFLLACEVATGDAIAYAGWVAAAADDNLAWLEQIYVLSTARRTGVAGALLQRVTEDSANATLKLRVNRHNNKAIAAYRRLGFVIETTDVKDIGGGFVMDDYIMRRPAGG